MDASSLIETVFLQLLVQDGDASPHPAEDDYFLFLSFIDLSKELYALPVFLFFMDDLDSLSNFDICLQIDIPDLDCDRVIAAEGTSEALYFFRPCSAKHQSLAVR